MNNFDTGAVFGIFGLITFIVAPLFGRYVSIKFIYYYYYYFLSNTQKWWIKNWICKNNIEYYAFLSIICQFAILPIFGRIHIVKYLWYCIDGIFLIFLVFLDGAYWLKKYARFWSIIKRAYFFTFWVN